MLTSLSCMIKWMKNANIFSFLFGSALHCFEWNKNLHHLVPITKHNKIKNYKRQICVRSVLNQICRSCVRLYIEFLWIATNLNKVDIVIRQMKFAHYRAHSKLIDTDYDVLHSLKEWRLAVWWLFLLRYLILM